MTRTLLILSLTAACGSPSTPYVDAARAEYEIAREELLIDRVTADAVARQYAIAASQPMKGKN